MRLLYSIEVINIWTIVGTPGKVRLPLVNLGYLVITLSGTIIARRKRFLRSTQANFRKSKKFIISNVEYRQESKKSKFDMNLISDSPFNNI